MTTTNEITVSQSSNLDLAAPYAAYVVQFNQFRSKTAESIIGMAETVPTFVRPVPVSIFRMKPGEKTASDTEAGIHAVLDCLLYIHRGIIQGKCKVKGGGNAYYINFPICPNVTNRWGV